MGILANENLQFGHCAHPVKCGLGLTIGGGEFIRK